MVSDASKKQAAQKKATATKRGGKAAAVASSKSAYEISNRNCTSVLCSHPLSRDIRLLYFMSLLRFVSGGEKPQPGVKTSLYHGQTRKLRRRVLSFSHASESCEDQDLPIGVVLLEDASIPIKKKRSYKTKEPIPVDKGIEEASGDGKLEESYKDPGSIMDVGVKRIHDPPPQIA